MHTMVKLQYNSGPTDIPSLPAELFRKMHYYRSVKFGINTIWDVDYTKDKDWADRIRSIALYDSMMFIHRKHGHGPLHRIVRGTEKFLNNEKQLQKDQYSIKDRIKFQWRWKQW